MPDIPEFFRPIPIRSLTDQSKPETIEASRSECDALAARFGLLSVKALAASAALERDGATITATGTVTAKIEQECVVSEDPVSQEIAEKFSLRFIPEGETPNAEEVELEEEDCETMYYEGGVIDLGEAAAQTMALALDPFPRSENAAQAARDAGVLQEEDIESSGPFAGLDSLIKKTDS